jgi:hypothetical protein
VFNVSSLLCLLLLWKERDGGGGRGRKREKRASSLISSERDRETGGDNKGESGNRFPFLSV